MYEKPYRQQGLNSRQNDAYGWFRVPHANRLLRVKTDQSDGNDGKIAV